MMIREIINLSDFSDQTAACTGIGIKSSAFFCS